jgi:glutamate synthase domain-containing protein 3
VRPPANATYPPEENAIVGNCALYGATGGEVFINGLTGDRFAVRNSGATAVVEGAGLHACEYMTRGCVAILGPVSYNVGAGMTGGVLYIRRPNAGFLNRNYLTPQELTADDEALLLALLVQHAGHVGSATARVLIERWDEEKQGFIRCTPLTQLQRAASAEPSGALTLSRA